MVQISTTFSSLLLVAASVIAVPTSSKTSQPHAPFGCSKIQVSNPGPPFLRRRMQLTLFLRCSFPSLFSPFYRYHQTKPNFACSALEAPLQGFLTYQVSTTSACHVPLFLSSSDQTLSSMSIAGQQPRNFNSRSLCTNHRPH